MSIILINILTHFPISCKVRPMEIPNNRPLFSLSISAKITGLPTKTLNYFEQQKLLSPLKTPGNRRLYSNNDLERIFTIKYLKINKGINSAGIKLLLEIIDYTNHNGLDLKGKFFIDLNEEELLKKHLHEEK